MSLSKGDPNFGAVGTNGNGQFEEWACEDFNLFEFVGQESQDGLFDPPPEDFDFNMNEEDSMHKNDAVYSTLQYNELMNANDQSNYRNLDNGYPNQYDNFPEHSYPQPNFGQELDKSQIPSTSKSSGLTLAPIKLEDTYDTNAYESSATGSVTDQGSTYAESRNGKYEPKLKPRKYRMKPETEKRNPQYRVKREKNNDAVRRSRDKAKRAQQEKEHRLAFLENEDIKSKRQLAQLEQRNQFLEKEIIRMKQVVAACRCGANARH